MRGRESDSQDPWGSWVRNQVWTKQEWNQRRSLGRRLSKQLGAEMPWVSDGGEGGKRWSDKTWWPVGFIKEKLQCRCDKTFKGKTSNYRTVAQLVSLNSQFPDYLDFRARGLQRFSTASGTEVAATDGHCVSRPLPSLYLPGFISDYSVKSPHCLKPARLPAVSRKWSVTICLQASAWDNFPLSH